MSPVGGTGDFYFENLPPGSHRATIVDSDGECTFTLKVPDANEPLIDLGTVRCLPQSSDR